jgi:hypothetical protein
LLFAERKIDKLICNSRETLQHFNPLKRFVFTQAEALRILNNCSLFQLTLEIPAVTYVQPDSVFPHGLTVPIGP